MQTNEMMNTAWLLRIAAREIEELRARLDRAHDQPQIVRIFERALMPQPPQVGSCVGVDNIWHMKKMADELEQRANAAVVDPNNDLRPAPPEAEKSAIRKTQELRPAPSPRDTELRGDGQE